MKTVLKTFLQFESLSNTLFPIARRVSLYLELISDESGDRTSIIVMLALSANLYSTRAEIFDKFVMYFLRFVSHEPTPTQTVFAIALKAKNAKFKVAVGDICCHTTVIFCERASVDVSEVISIVFT